MKYNKFYIIAMAASGKSTFAANNATYNGYRIIDFAENLPPITRLTKLIRYVSRFLKPARKLIRHRADIVARREENYFSSVFEFITNHKEPVVVLGRRPPHEFEALPVHDSVKFAMVLIPEEDHRRNCASRKRELKNPLPLFHHWTTNFEKINEVRKRLTVYASQHNIPLYDNFDKAVVGMHERFNSSRSS